jgi:hypothetical protein
MAHRFSIPEHGDEAPMGAMSLAATEVIAHRIPRYRAGDLVRITHGTRTGSLATIDGRDWHIGSWWVHTNDGLRMRYMADELEPWALRDVGDV